MLVTARAPFVSLLLDAPPAPAVASSQFFVVRPDPRRMRPDFLAFVLASPLALAHFQQGAQGTTLSLINLTALGALPVPLPPLDAQARVAQVAALLNREATLLQRRATLAVARTDALTRRLLGT